MLTSILIQPQAIRYAHVVSLQAYVVASLRYYIQCFSSHCLT